MYILKKAESGVPGYEKSDAARRAHQQAAFLEDAERGARQQLDSRSPTWKVDIAKSDEAMRVLGAERNRLNLIANDQLVTDLNLHNSLEKARGNKTLMRRGLGTLAVAGALGYGAYRLNKRNKKASMVKEALSEDLLRNATMKAVDKGVEHTINAGRAANTAMYDYDIGMADKRLAQSKRFGEAANSKLNKRIEVNNAIVRDLNTKIKININNIQPGFSKKNALITGGVLTLGAGAMAYNIHKGKKRTESFNQARIRKNKKALNTLGGM